MKLRGISIEYSECQDDEFKPFWTFVIKGMSPDHSVGQMHVGNMGKQLAQERAEQIVKHFLLSGE